MQLFTILLFEGVCIFSGVYSSHLGSINVPDSDYFLPEPNTKTIFRQNPVVESFLAYKQAKSVAASEAQFKSVYGSVEYVPQVTQSVGFTFNTGSLIQPQAEILRLVEAFIRLKAEILGRLQILYNDNYGLIHNLINLLLSNLGKLSLFTVNGISILRSILEFSANLFSGWNITLPNVSVNAGGGIPRPHTTYGVPPATQSFHGFSGR